jgi:SurA-like N-terminal domain
MGTMTAALARALLSLLAVQNSELGVAARINDEVVTWDEIDGRLSQASRDEITPELRRSELRQAVQERLFLQKAKALEIKVAEEEIDSRIELIKKQQMGKPDEAKEVIERRFRDYLAHIRQTLAEFRSHVRVEMITSRVIGRLVMDGMNHPGLHSTLLTELVSPDEVREYYRIHPDEFKALFNISVGRIAMRFANDAEKAVKLRLMESVRRKIECGADFQVMALYYSELTTGNERFFGYRELKPEASEFLPATNQTIFHDLKEGEMSTPLVDRGTVNLFRLERRVNEKGESFEDAQGRIRALLENQKREVNRRRMRDELLKTSYLEPADLFE